MRDTIRFWFRCAAFAAKGTVAFANDWAWLFGVPATAVILSFLASAGGNSVTGSVYIDAVLTGAVAFVITWFTIFFVRLLAAPAALYQQASAGKTVNGGDAKRKFASESTSEPFGTLREKTNSDLLRITVDFAAQLRTFETNARLTWIEGGITVPSDAPEYERQEAAERNAKRLRRLALSEVTEFKNRYQHPAVQLKDELQSRLGKAGIFIAQDRYNGSLIALDGHLAGAHPITDVADFLEKLARKLP
jgi:hypothetical protein